MIFFYYIKSLFIVFILLATGCSENEAGGNLPPANTLSIDKNRISGKITVDGYFFRPTGTIDIHVDLKIKSVTGENLKIIASIIHPKTNSVILSNERKFKRGLKFNRRIENIFGNKPLLLGKHKLEIKIFIENDEFYVGYTDIEVRVEASPSYGFENLLF